MTQDYEAWNQDLAELKVTVSHEPSPELKAASEEATDAGATAADQNSDSTPLDWIANTVALLQREKKHELLRGEGETWLDFNTGERGFEPVIVEQIARSVPSQIGKCLVYLENLHKLGRFENERRKLHNAQKVVLRSLNFLLEYRIIDPMDVKNSFVQDKTLSEQVGAHLFGCFVDDFKETAGVGHPKPCYQTIMLPFREDLTTHTQTDHIHAVLEVFENAQWKAVIFPFLQTVYWRIKSEGALRVSAMATEVMELFTTPEFHKGIDQTSEDYYQRNVQDMIMLIEDPRKILAQDLIYSGDVFLASNYIFAQLFYVAAYASPKNTQPGDILKILCKKLETVKNINQAIIRCKICVGWFESIGDSIDVLKTNKELRWKVLKMKAEIQEKLAEAEFHSHQRELIQKINSGLSCVKDQEETLGKDQDMYSWFQSTLIAGHLENAKGYFNILKEKYESIEELEESRQDALKEMDDILNFNKKQKISYKYITKLFDKFKHLLKTIGCQRL